MKWNKFKSLILFCLILMIFLGLSCVSAQDANETSQDLEDGIDLDVDVISMSDDDILTDDGSFSELQAMLKS